MSDGTTAIQVSPADVNSILTVVKQVEVILSAYSAMQIQVGELSFHNESLMADNDRQAAALLALQSDYNTTLSKLHLLELAHQGTNDELVRTNEALRLSREDLERWLTNYMELETKLRDTRRERDDIGFRHLEVTEKLEVAETKLNKFRELLGDARDMSGTSAAVSTAAAEPVPDYMQPTAEVAHPGADSVPAISSGDGGDTDSVMSEKWPWKRITSPQD